MYGWAIALLLVGTVSVAILTGAASALGGSVVQILFVAIVVIGLIAMIATETDEGSSSTDGPFRPKRNNRGKVIEH